MSAFSKTPIYWHDFIPGDMTAKSLAFAVSMVTASQPLSVSAHLGVYSIVNSTSASLMGSVSEAYVVSSATSVSLSGACVNPLCVRIGCDARRSGVAAATTGVGVWVCGGGSKLGGRVRGGGSEGCVPLGLRAGGGCQQALPRRTRVRVRLLVAARG